MRELRASLESQTDAAGRAFEIIDLPAPATLRDDEGFVDWSYVNHLVVNGGVIACGFGDERADAAPRDILADAYPGREVRHRRRARRSSRAAAASTASPSSSRLPGASRGRAPRRPRSDRMSTFDVVEASIADLRDALEAGTSRAKRSSPPTSRASTPTTARHGTALNAVVVRNPEALAEARASDARRAAGNVRGPARRHPVHGEGQLPRAGAHRGRRQPRLRRPRRAAGRLHDRAPARRAARSASASRTCRPMANGGMQRGVYGRAESPYNADFLTAAFGSGSSNGSGTATAASFAAFGLGEETWSSGRARHRTTPSAPTRRRAASSRCAATGRSCRRWMSSCRTPARWPTCSRCST